MEGALSLLFHRANTSAEAEEVKKKSFANTTPRFRCKIAKMLGVAGRRRPGPAGCWCRAPWSRATRRRRLPALAAGILAYTQC